MQSIIRETLKLIRPITPTSIHFLTEIDETLPPILADDNQMHQVLVNLCTNASQAMNKEEGFIKIVLKKKKFRAKEHCRLPQGEYLYLKIADTGEGISPDIINQIFDPFFTTKEVGKGTGLGLSVVHGIITKSGGDISVESTLGEGTSFSIYLPFIRAKEPCLPKKARLSIHNGTPSILIVDDEVAITNLMKRLLERKGYKVQTQNSSLEALELFKNHNKAFDLIITDLTMPDINGITLAKKIHTINVNIPVILESGYTLSITDKIIKESGINAVVTKPVDVDTLVQLIQKVLQKEEV